MDMELIVNYAVQIIGSLIGLAMLYFAPSVKNLIETKLGVEKTQKLLLLIKTLVYSAEQQLKECDTTGEERKDYVVSQLNKLGIEVTEDVMDMIEGMVLELNKEVNKPKEV